MRWAERFAQVAQHVDLHFGGVINLLIATLIQESLVPTDSGLGDYFKDAAGGAFHKTRIIHLGRLRAAFRLINENVMCALPAASDKLTSALMPMVCAIHMGDSPGLRRGWAVHARCRQGRAEPKY